MYLDVKSCSGDKDVKSCSGDLGKCPRFAGYFPSKSHPWAFSRIVSLEGRGICLGGRTWESHRPREKSHLLSGRTLRVELQECHGHLYVEGLPGNFLSELSALRPGLLPCYF